MPAKEIVGRLLLCFSGMPILQLMGKRQLAMPQVESPTILPINRLAVSRTGHISQQLSLGDLTRSTELVNLADTEFDIVNK